jgi:hypothetical protein
MTHMGFDGSNDYFDLFADDAEWPLAAKRVRVFKIYGSWVANYATDEELRTVVQGLSRRGIALGLEIGAFLATPECGSGIEGFDGSLETIDRIKRAGGTVAFVAFDEPLAFGHVYQGPNSCHWTMEEAAQRAAAFAAALRGALPGVVIGDIEPLWTEISAEDIGTWLQAFARAAGQTFGFLHLDVDWGRPEWPGVALDAERAARERGVPLGIIYNGGDADSDERWNELAVGRMYAYEEKAGGRPDQVVFQSWMDHPDRVLPESDATTFTGLIDRYFGPRTRLRIGDPVRVGTGKWEIDGALGSTDGSPVAGALVEVDATPLDGPYQVLDLRGKVPVGATSAVVGVRMNIEGAGPGEADLTIYRIAYREGTSTANRVPNGSFATGLDGWDVAGNGTTSTPPSDHGSGRMVRLTATPDRSLLINSAGFPATPGAAFRLSVAARVPESSSESAYVAVIFLHDSEIARERLALAPARIDLGEISTEATGGFLLSLGDLEAGRYRFRLTSRGDASHWPSTAVVVLTFE